MSPKLFLAAVTLFSVSFGVNAPASESVIDYTKDGPHPEWKSADDNVMGGRSRGTFEVKDDHLLFTGDIVTDGGGFSSIRTKDRDWGLDEGDGLIVRCKGDGRTYLLELRTDAKWGRMPVTYSQEFQTKNGEWTEAKIPFENFEPKVFGSSVDDPLPDDFNEAKIKMFGLDQPFDENLRKVSSQKVTTIAIKLYDKKDGPFKFSLQRVSVYDGTSKPSLPEVWTSNDNKTINATVVGYDLEQKVITFRIVGGQDTKVPLARLTEEGQKRILALYPGS